MSALMIFDTGGTSIKYGVMDQGKLVQTGKIPTPDNLEAYYESLTNKLKEIRMDYDIVGVAMSSPGAVNKQTGVIEGISALPYIHFFPIQPEFEQRFELPVTIENDANCAGLAEMDSGAGVGMQNVCFVVIGSGIGGANIVNQKIQHGHHLYGGEFGIMILQDGKTLSQLGSSLNIANRYNKRRGTNLTTIEIFEREKNGDSVAAKEIQTFFHYLAIGILDISYSIDPECIILGGGISQADFLLPRLKAEIKAVLATLEPGLFEPKVVPCHYLDAANLIGAAVDFRQTYPEIANQV